MGGKPHRTILKALLSSSRLEDDVDAARPKLSLSDFVPTERTQATGTLGNPLILVLETFE